MTVTEEKNATNQCKTTAAAALSRMSQLSQSKETKKKTTKKKTKQGLTPAFVWSSCIKMSFFFSFIGFSLGSKNVRIESIGNTQIPVIINGKLCAKRQNKSQSAYLN